MDGFKPQNVKHQIEMLIYIMCWLLRGKNPHTQQVRVFCWLVYKIGNTILITKTSFGKSIVFYAFSVLTSQIIIQFILLSKLGGEQIELIRQYPGINLCLILVDMKSKTLDCLKTLRMVYIFIYYLGQSKLYLLNFKKSYRIYSSNVKLD